jgi:very-short-patch-repair endonuclease
MVIFQTGRKTILMRHLPYNVNLKEFSRHLRNNSTIGEVRLWMYLKRGQMMGYTFNRQKPLDKYVVDFYCAKLKLVIEVDGDYHNEEEQIVADDIRQNVLEEFKLNFLRFTERECVKEIDMVLASIEGYIKEWEKKHPK